MKTSTGTIPELARQWLEAQANGGVFPKKLDWALLEAPATAAADVVALLEVVKRDFTVCTATTRAGSR